MKYCQYCGTQVSDDVYFCPACGKMLASPSMTFAPPAPQPTPAPATTPVEPQLLKPKTPSVGLYTMNFLFWLFAGFVMFLIVIALGNADVDVYASLHEGYYYTDINAYAYFEPEETANVFAIFFTIPTVVFAIIGFVKTLTQRLRVNYVYAAILRLLLSFALFFGSIAIAG